jgi:hypothetical protein
VQAPTARLPLPPGSAVARGQDGSPAGGAVESMTQQPRAAAACILLLRPRAAGAGTAGGAAADAALRAVAQAAVRGWDASRRVVLQGPDGLAIAGAVAPQVALQALRRAMRHPQAASVAMALHHGPLRVLSGEAGAARLAGDGLTRAAVLAGLTGARPLVSGAFRQALATAAPRAAQDLQPATEVTGPGGEALFRDDEARSRARGQRRTLFAALGLAAIIAAGWGVHIARELYEAAHRPAWILLDVRPSGEVFVDGVSQGMAPPLERVPVPAGLHTIEVRNARAKPLRLQVQLQPGQELPLTHVFPPPPPPRPAPAARPKAPAAPAGPAPGPLERFKFW